MAHFSFAQRTVSYPLGGGVPGHSMIQQLSRNLISTDTHTFDVECTPGGHFIRVSNKDESWAGLFRCEKWLVLVARCRGEPPTRLCVEADVVSALQQMIIDE